MFCRKLHAWFAIMSKPSLSVFLRHLWAKKLVGLQLSRTASDVLSEFEVIIINTAKIKSCFWQKTKPVLSKTLVSLDTPLIYDLNGILVTDIWSSFCRMTELIIQIQRPWKTSEMSLPLYKWHHKRQLIYVLPKKQSMKNNYWLYIQQSCRHNFWKCMKLLSDHMK